VNDERPAPDELAVESAEHFRRMVESVGVKRFSSCMELSTRQVNRMLSGAQPNPVDRLVRCLQSCQADVGDEALGFICQEAGGLFIKDEEPDLDQSAVHAIRECAEAIAAISDGHVTRMAEKQVREAICALTALLRAVREDRFHHSGAPAHDGQQTGPAIITTRAAPATRDGVAAQSA